MIGIIPGSRRAQRFIPMCGVVGGGLVSRLDRRLASPSVTHRSHAQCVTRAIHLAGSRDGWPGVERPEPSQSATGRPPYQFSCVIWMRLPQVSFTVAILEAVTSVGGIVNSAPLARIRSKS